MKLPIVTTSLKPFTNEFGVLSAVQNSFDLFEKGI